MVIALKVLFLVGCLMLCSSYAQAAVKITNLWFCGPDDQNHPNVVQMTIKGGFLSGSCDSSYAAIRLSMSKA